MILDERREARAGRALKSPQTLANLRFMGGLRFRLHFLLVLCTGMLVLPAAAQEKQDVSVPPNYSEPIRLAVAEIQVIPIYVSPAREPNVEHLFPTPPAVAAEQWAKAHLRPVGYANRATVIIRDAHVTETKLEKKSGLSGLFTREPSERYDAVLDVEIEIRDSYDRFIGRVTAQVTRTQTVLEKTEPEERQAIWAQMTEAMIDDLDHEIARQMRAHLTSFVR